MTQITILKFEPGNVLLDRYEIVEMLGYGGYAMVYKVKDTIGEGDETRIRALKVAKVRDTSARFLQEIRIAQEINDDGVVRIYDSGRLDEEYYYCTMEYMPGGTLEDYLKEGALDFPTAVEVLKRIASALKALHDQGVIHRDLKPANILLPEDFPKNTDVKVSDLGIAKNQNREVVLTQGDNSMMGTIAYMSPEQCLPRERLVPGEDIDSRTDIFAFGMVAYEMVAGHHIYKDSLNEMADLVKQILSDDEAPSLAADKKKVPPWFSTLVARCLRKEREERYESIEEVCKALDEGKVGFHWRSTKGRILCMIMIYAITMAVAYAHLALFIKIPGNSYTGIFASSFDSFITKQWFSLRGPVKSNNEVVVIAVDRPSHEELGIRLDKPWPRSVMAQLLEKLSEAPPKAVFLDYIYLKNMGDIAETKRLANAMRGVTTYVVRSRDYENNISLPEDILMKSSAGLFDATINTDTDGAVREFYPPGYSDTDETVRAESNYHLQLDRSSLPRYGDLINFYGKPKSITNIPFHKVLKDEQLARGLKDKYVFVGLYLEVPLSAAAGDVHKTAYAPNMPGVEIHATRMSNLLSRDWIRKLPNKTTILINLLAAAMMTLLIITADPKRTGLLLTITLATVWTIGLYVLFTRNIFLSGFGLLFIIIALYASTFARYAKK